MEHDMKDIDSDFRFRTTDRPGGKDLDVFVDNKKRTVWLRRGMSRTEALRAAFASGAVVQKLRQQPKPAPKSQLSVTWVERVFVRDESGETKEYTDALDIVAGTHAVRSDLSSDQVYDAGYIAGWMRAQSTVGIETE